MSNKNNNQKENYQNSHGNQNENINNKNQEILNIIENLMKEDTIYKYNKNVLDLVEIVEYGHNHIDNNDHTEHSEHKENIFNINNKNNINNISDVVEEKNNKDKYYNDQDDRNSNEYDNKEVVYRDNIKQNCTKINPNINSMMENVARDEIKKWLNTNILKIVEEEVAKMIKEIKSKI